MTLGRDVVLIVDDDLAVCDALKFALELEGFSVRTFDSGAALLAHPGLGEADCILLDYRMPVMDGLEVMERLAAKNLRVPVILVTSQANKSVSRRAQAAGIHQVIEKPLLDGALLHTIHDALGQPRHV